MTIEATSTPAPEVAASVPSDPMADALAAYKAVATPAEVGAAPDPASPPAPVQEPAATPAPHTAAPAAPESNSEEAIARKLESVIARLANTEREKVTSESELKSLRAKVAEFEALVAGAEENPELLFDKVKWNPERVKAYAEKGKAALNPEMAAVKREMEALKAQQAEMAAARAAAEQQNAVATYKAEIARETAALPADAHPHLRKAVDGGELTDVLFGIMQRAYQGGQGKILTVAEAAHAAESHWAGVAKRLGVSLSAPATAVVTKTPVSAPVPKPKVVVEDDGEMDDFQRALKVMRQVARSV